MALIWATLDKNHGHGQGLMRRTRNNHERRAAIGRPVPRRWFPPGGTRTRSFRDPSAVDGSDADRRRRNRRWFMKSIRRPRRRLPAASFARPPPPAPPTSDRTVAKSPRWLDGDYWIISVRHHPVLSNWIGIIIRIRVCETSTEFTESALLRTRLWPNWTRHRPYRRRLASARTCAELEALGNAPRLAPSGECAIPAAVGCWSIRRRRRFISDANKFVRPSCVPESSTAKRCRPPKWLRRVFRGPSQRSLGPSTRQRASRRSKPTLKADFLLARNLHRHCPSPLNCVRSLTTDCERRCKKANWIIRCFTFLPRISGFYRVLTSFISFYRAVSNFYRSFLGFTEFYRVLLFFTRFFLVLPNFTGFFLVSTRCYRVVPNLTDFSGFDPILPSFTGFLLDLM